jgi:phage shock protein C
MVNTKKSLYRLPKQGQIFGVCAGLADYFEIDVTLMRVIFVVLAFATGGAMILLYIILAVVLPTPEKDSAYKSSKAKSSENDDYITERVQKLGQELHENKVVTRTRNYLGVGLLLLGVWLLLGQIFPGWFNLRWDYIWPVLLILTGFLIIARRGNGQ